MMSENSLDPAAAERVGEAVEHAATTVDKAFPGIFDDHLLATVQAAAEHAAALLLPEVLVTEAAAQAEEAAGLVDSLTGLDNRRGLQENLRRAIELVERHGLTLTLVSFYFDNLKDINDSRGHLAGDAALETSARILRSRTPTTVVTESADELSTVQLRGPARLEAGDEFGTLHVNIGRDEVVAWWNNVNNELLESGIIMGAGFARYEPVYGYCSNAAEYLFETAASAQLTARYKGGVLRDGGVLGNET
jgi:GGDEF domain-containing protein